MLKNGLQPIKRDKRDYDFHKSFGTIGFDVTTLPADFSIWDGRVIPNQNEADERFSPALPPLPYGCTGETTTMMAGLEDGSTYNPQFTFDSTPPGTLQNPQENIGRDIRAALQSAIDIGLKSPDGTIGNKRTAYFSIKPSGILDWFDAVRVAIWITQQEKRGASLGTWWYEQDWTNPIGGILPMPSLKTALGTLHNHLATGWQTIDGIEYIEDISWQGDDYGNAGKDYISRPIFNALMAQWQTGAFTTSKIAAPQLETIDWGIVEALIGFIHNLMGAL